MLRVLLLTGDSAAVGFGTVLLKYYILDNIGAVVFGRDNVFYMFLFGFNFFSFVFFVFDLLNRAMLRGEPSNQFNHVFINLPCEGQTKIQYIDGALFEIVLHTDGTTTHTLRTKLFQLFFFLFFPTNDLTFVVNENETFREWTNPLVCANCDEWNTSTIKQRQSSRTHNRFQKKLSMQSVFSAVAVNGYREYAQPNTATL